MFRCTQQTKKNSPTSMYWSVSSCHNCTTSSWHCRTFTWQTIVWNQQQTRPINHISDSSMFYGASAVSVLIHLTLRMSCLMNKCELHLIKLPMEVFKWRSPRMEFRMIVGPNRVLLESIYQLGFNACAGLPSWPLKLLNRPRKIRVGPRKFIQVLGLYYTDLDVSGYWSNIL